jgi:small-conductance mechanosensitive channel
VQNFKKMEERRVVTEFGITYETPQEKVRAVDGMVQDIITQIKAIRFDRVHFKAFGDSALIFELVYYVESDDYNMYMDAQEQFNFALLEAFAQAGIDFAYPTQTIYTQTAT